MPPGVEARRAVSGSERDKGNESESGERAAMEAENVRKCARERGCGRGRRKLNGVVGVIGVIGVVGALVSRDADHEDAQDIVGLGIGRAYNRGSGSRNADEGRDSDGENGES
jgi:hypothetical protein